MSKSIAIHQPNFFPWLGFFHKISMVEEFIFMDHVQVTMGKGWHSRVRFLFNGQEKWLTVPIIRSGRSGQKYYDIQLDEKQPYAKKHLGVLKQAYSRAPYIKDVMPVIEAFYSLEINGLAERNIIVIEMIAELMGLNSTFSRTSDLENENPQINDLKGNELVLELTKLSNAGSYVSGRGCLDFIDPVSFNDEGIEFYFQGFNCGAYKQIGTDDFYPGLSVLDAAMNLGWDEVGNMLLNNKR